jgi:hypothetical protein
MRRILDEVATTVDLAEVRDILSLRRFEVLPDGAYDRLADLERQAASLGYPAVA